MQDGTGPYMESTRCSLASVRMVVTLLRLLPCARTRELICHTSGVRRRIRRYRWGKTAWQSHLDFLQNLLSEPPRAAWVGLHSKYWPQSRHSKTDSVLTGSGEDLGSSRAHRQARHSKIIYTPTFHSERMLQHISTLLKMLLMMMMLDVWLSLGQMKEGGERLSVEREEQGTRMGLQFSAKGYQVSVLKSTLWVHHSSKWRP